jgi:hypothetical protein
LSDEIERTHEQILSDKFKNIFCPGGFESEDSRIVLEHLARFTSFYSPSLVVAKDGHTDALAMAYAEGKRAVFLEILFKLEKKGLS